MPDFTPLRDINRRRALAQQLSQQPFNRQSTASGLAHLVRQHASGRASNIASEQEQSNAQIRQREIGELLNVLQGGTQVPLQTGQFPQFQTPDIQNMAVQAQLQKAQDERRQQGQQRFGQTPVFTRGPEGIGMGQLGTQGGFFPAQPPEGQQFILPGSQAGFDPASIATRGQAQTQQDVAATQALAAPEAQAAAQTQQAVGDILTQQQQVRGQEAADIQVNTRDRLANAEFQRELNQRVQRRVVDFERTQQKQTFIDGLIDGAIENSNAFTTGLGGTLLEFIPGTPAFDLVAQVDSIKANVGFDKLQQMRSDSPTGGALGQVSEFENRLLQAVLGNLENSQSTDQFVSNLRELKTQLDQIVNRGISPQGGANTNFQLTPTGRTTPEGRPVFTNQFGDEMTEFSITVTDQRINQGRATNIPSLFDGRIVSDREAIQRIVDAGGKDPVTGRVLEGFNSIQEAEAAARSRSAGLGSQGRSNIRIRFDTQGNQI